MGASCPVWANALAAIKKATRNAKDSARICQSRHYISPQPQAKRKLYGKSRGRSPARPAWDRTRPISVRILRLFDCPLAGVRDLHADDLDRTSAHLHRIALHARKPVADKICQHLGWEAVLNQHFDGAAARLCICQHFEGSALLRADHYNLLRKHSRRYQRRPAPAISPPALYGARAVAS